MLSTLSVSTSSTPDPVPSTAHSVTLYPLRHIKRRLVQSSRASILPKPTVSFLSSSYSNSQHLTSPSTLTQPSWIRVLRAPGVPRSSLVTPPCPALAARVHAGHRAQDSGHLFSSCTLETATPTRVTRQLLSQLGRLVCQG